MVSKNSDIDVRGHKDGNLTGQRLKAVSESQNSKPCVKGYSEPWQLKVLVVEDSPTEFHWVNGALTSMDEFDVVVWHAPTVEDARKLIGEQSFDVALIDYQLPDGLGDEVLAAFKHTSGRCASIMVSGHRMSEVSLFAQQGGAVAAINKDDLNPELLETTIRFALSNQAARVCKPQLD